MKTPIEQLDASIIRLIRLIGEMNKRLREIEKRLRIIDNHLNEELEEESE